MIINVANFNFGGDSGGGGKPALLQEKTATIVQNGSQTITPDEGFDGMSSVQINAAITGDSSAIDFSSIGYDAEFSAELNAKYNNDVAYSKTLYDKWNPNNTSTFLLYSGDTRLVYAPNIDTSNVTRADNMFNSCKNLKVVPKYNTSNVEDTSQMFIGCANLISVKKFDTSKVTNMFNMFSGCNSITTIPDFDTINVKNMSGMFGGCYSLTTVPKFNTSNVESMHNMFANCSGITSVLDFDTSNVESMYGMFYNCVSLTTVPAFNVSKVTTFQKMFSGCKSLTSLPELNTINVKNFSWMFEDCDKLTTIEGISFKSFSDSTMDMYYLFSYSSNSSIRKAVFKDIGYNSNTKKFDMSNIKNWGVNTDEIPDARQSVIDSLITYSFDRATAGYPTCEITLSSNTKPLLTEDEKAQITAKGFTIA